ncbi:peroxisomal leader peptide-processing protease [Battus philenor]|uniref:peroxisomal leader peptide-processing protease n=1 Tax=Battus philenor TaxID=42288 RepID=UPI0035CF59EA
MDVEGVMVSYNYSEAGEHAKILTVSASGIKFSERWVLTHGSILSPLKEAEAIRNAKRNPILNQEFYDKLPEIYVTCEKVYTQNPDVYDEVEHLSWVRSVSNNNDFEHSSYLIRVLTGRICHVWQCPILERCVDDVLYSWTIGHRDADVQQQTQLGKALLSVFVLIDLESDNLVQQPLRPLSELLDLVHPPPGRGSVVEVQSTPFGCEVFLNAVTRGSVCGVVGRRPSLLLTDAATALGSEGGPVFSFGENRQLVGAVVCSVSWWRGEWVGLSLVAPLRAVLTAKLHVPAAPLLPSLPPTEHMQHFKALLDTIDSTTVLVRCGAAWGAGVYLGGGHSVTCAHVVKNHETEKVTVYCQGVKETAIVRYKASDDVAYDIALVYSNPQNWKHLTAVTFTLEQPKKGEPVLAAGFPYFSENNLTDVRPMVTRGHLNNVSPSMLQTSCCVQSGFSGGPIFRLSRGTAEVLGITVSNAKTETGAYYPYINMAIPARAFVTHMKDYILNKDKTKLREIENKNEVVQSQWRLLPYRSKI